MKPDEPTQLDKPTGWYVRVTTAEPNPRDAAYNSLLYLVGIASEDEALEAVRLARSGRDIGYESAGEAIIGWGPQPVPGEVRLLDGAV